MEVLIGCIVSAIGSFISAIIWEKRIIEYNREFGKQGFDKTSLWLQCALAVIFCLLVVISFLFNSDPEFNKNLDFWGRLTTNFLFLLCMPLFYLMPLVNSKDLLLNKQSKIIIPVFYFITAVILSVISKLFIPFVYPIALLLGFPFGKYFISKRIPKRYC